MGALAREGLVYSPLSNDEAANRIDDALHLLQPLEIGPRAAAIGGGWAAIEALLISAGEQPREIAADRLASIVACSYPRAELTTLAYIHHRKASDDLAKGLAGASDNLTRARLVADAITAGTAIATRGAGDAAATARMMELLQDPSPVLRTVRQYVGAALRRLYRNRNLILHGGLVSGAGRGATLLTVPPLVGAGVDRVVHAYFTEGLAPVELAARAELRLGLAGASAGRHVTELLEP